MSLETILRQQFADADRARVQDEAINSAIGRTEMHIQRYCDDPRSFGGRYVAADLFKETFEQYAESKESRNRYNLPVHNSAAVLSAEQLRRLIAEVDPSRDKLIFLTGIPGAGKTSSVLVGSEATRPAQKVSRHLRGPARASRSDDPEDRASARSGAHSGDLRGPCDPGGGDAAIAQALHGGGQGGEHSDDGNHSGRVAGGAFGGARALR